MQTVAQLESERPVLQEYATDPADPSYISAPTSQETQQGTSPLDVLPAQWWNFYTQQLTQLNNTYLKFMKDVLGEIAAVVGGADGTSGSNQLKTWLDDKFAAVAGDVTNILATTTPKAVAASAAVGTSEKAARADHVHAYTFSTTNPANLAASAAVGTSTLPARSDHVHKLPAGTTVAKDWGTASAGTSTELSRVDHVHPTHIHQVTSNISNPVEGDIYYNRYNVCRTLSNSIQLLGMGSVTFVDSSFVPGVLYIYSSGTASTPNKPVIHTYGNTGMAIGFVLLKLDYTNTAAAPKLALGAAVYTIYQPGKKAITSVTAGILAKGVNLLMIVDATSMVVVMSASGNAYFGGTDLYLGE